MTGFAKDFTELEVYQESRMLAGRVFEMTKRFPSEEKYSLIDQFRRSSRSIGAQIAEVWGKRRYPRHFVSKLSDADAEQLEARHWVRIALDCGYLCDDEANSLVDVLGRIGGMLTAMMKKADQFRV